MKKFKDISDIQKMALQWDIEEKNRRTQFQTLGLEVSNHNMAFKHIMQEYYILNGMFAKMNKEFITSSQELTDAVLETRMQFENQINELRISNQKIQVHQFVGGILKHFVVSKTKGNEKNFQPNR